MYYIGAAFGFVARLVAPSQPQPVQDKPQLDLNPLFQQAVSEVTQSQSPTSASPVSSPDPETLISAPAPRVPLARDAFKQVDTEMEFWMTLQRRDLEVTDFEVRRAVRRCYSQYISGERPLTEAVVEDICDLAQEVQFVQRELGQLGRAKGLHADAVHARADRLQRRIKEFEESYDIEQEQQIIQRDTDLVDFSSSLVMPLLHRKIQLEKKIQRLEQLRLCSQIVRDKKLSQEKTDELKGWLDAQFTTDREEMVEPSKINPEVAKRLLTGLTEIELTELLKMLDSNPILPRQKLFELQKMRELTKTLLEWLEDQKQENSSQIPSVMREIVCVFANWLKDIDAFLKTDSAKTSEGKLVVEQLKQLRLVLEHLQEAVRYNFNGLDEPKTQVGVVAVLESLQQKFPLFLPLYGKMINARDPNPEWLKEEDRDAYHNATMKMAQNPVKVTLLCKEALKRLKSKEAQLSAVKAYVTIRAILMKGQCHLAN